MQDINKMYPEIVKRLKDKHPAPWSYQEVSNVFAKYFSIINPKTVRAHILRMASDDFGILSWVGGREAGTEDKFTEGPGA